MRNRLSIMKKSSAQNVKIQRNAEIDVWRFLAALMIMWHHLYVTGIESAAYKFHDGHIYVEFFFLITGYYTARHFKQHPVSNPSLDTRAKDAIKYTFSKFKYIFGICAVITIIQHILFVFFDDADVTYKIKKLANLPSDLALLTNLYQRPLVTSFWFISTLLITLPFAAIVMSSSKKIFHGLLAFLCIGFYYGYIIPDILKPLNMVSNNGEDLLRGYICLYAGCFLCEATDFLSEKINRKSTRVLLFIIGEMALIATAVFAYSDHGSFIHVVLLFMLALICIWCNNIKTSSGFVQYLGKISLYIYVWNWTVGTFIYYIIKGVDATQIKVLYFVITMVLSVLTERIIALIKSHNKFL